MPHGNNARGMLLAGTGARAGERNCCAGSRKAAQKETAAGKDCRFLKYVYIYFFLIFYTI